MEYEKHIKKLVLGYLKSECKTSYKVFFKLHFPHERKHVSTRVAGQTLEDILRMLSKIQDIVQGHLEDTDYYKEYPAEQWSPTHLEEQLLYLLDRKRSSSPTTSIPDGSSRSTSVSSNHELGDMTPASNVEATPEHALPGNSNVLYHRMETDRRAIKNPYFDEMDVSMKLLYDKSFSHNLARTINKQLTPPESAGKDKTCLNVNEETIRNVIDRTESDPAINQLLDDIVADTLEKVIMTGAESSLFSNTKPNSSNRTYVDDQINGAVSSILAISQEASTSVEQDPSINKKPEVTSTTAPSAQTSTNSNSQPLLCEERESAKPGTSQNQNQNTSILTVDTQQQLTCQTPSRFFTLPSRAVTTPVLGCQQQYLIVNTPINVSQSSQMVQLLPKPIVVDSGRKTVSKANAGLTEEDIMSMPTLILNENNEVTYADINGIQLNTPFKLNEVHNLQEYFKAFGPSEQSPVIKKITQKKNSSIRPTPTIKVEIYKHDAPPPQQSKDTEVPAPSQSALPNLNETSVPVPLANKPSELSTEVAIRSTPDEIKVTSSDRGLLKSSRSAHTPSPLVTAVKKPTPKSSSHVRNLTFPSPVRKTSDMSPSKVNKQKATKDLFNEESKEAAVEKPKSKTSPKKSGSPSKSKQKVKKAVKKPPVAKKVVPAATASTVECTSNSWDAALRKNLPQEEHKTPARRTSARRRATKSSELDTSDPDGKKLEDALKTPAKAKTANPKKSKVEKVKVDKKATEELKPELPANLDSKTVLSPSKLCNTASKRNMEFDGITPHNPKTLTQQQPVMNARKNINSLLETPMKEDTVQTQDAEPGQEPTTSPFTPMLKANLQDFGVAGDTFTIATPNFPVTPGLALMEASTSNAYYIAAETEENKAAEEIVRAEERKSSTRKTDDDDLEVARSPKVYSRPEMLEAFNKSRAGKKDLDLIEKAAELSDIEEGSEKSSSLSDGESNKTVIRKLPTPQQVKDVKRSRRLSGKSMTVLKAYMLDSGDSSIIRLNEPTNQDKTTTKSLLKTGSSSDSEVVSKATYKRRASNEKANSSFTSKRRNSADSPPPKESKTLNKEMNKKIDIEDITMSSITTEKVKETVRSVTFEHQSGLPVLTSVKEEMEEKRRRMIELEKAKLCKTPSRRKNANTKRQTPQTSKGKRRVSKNYEDLEHSEKIDSQDEFFIKSGSNLHRKAKQMSNADDKREDLKERKVASKSEKTKSVEQESKKEVTSSSKSSEAPVLDLDTPVSPPSGDEDSFWDTSCTFDEQNHVFHITYDESNPSKRRFESYDLSVLNKGIRNGIPLEEGGCQIVTTHATMHMTLWEIPGDNEIGASSRRNSAVERRDLPADSDNEIASPRLDESGEHGGAKKRKHRSDSSSSTSSAKRMKTPQSQLFSLVNEKNIKTILNKLHGPTDKT